MKEHDPDQFSWSIKGRGGEPQKQVTRSVTMNTPRRKPTFKISDEVRGIEKNEQMGILMTEDAELIFVAYGIMSRTCKEAITVARKQGLKVGMIRPITLYPYPVKAFEKLSENLKGFVSVEMSALGQMVEDVRLAVNGRKPVYNYATGKMIPDTEEFISYAKNVLEGKEESV